MIMPICHGTAQFLGSPRKEKSRFSLPQFRQQAGAVIAKPHNSRLMDRGPETCVGRILFNPPFHAAWRIKENPPYTDCNGANFKK